jgi:hypothetical protein
LNLQSSFDLSVERDRLPEIRRQVRVPAALSGRGPSTATRRAVSSDLRTPGRSKRKTGNG